jgi:phenylacetic acid degradation protein
MPKVYAIDGITPVIDVTAFVHPSAVLIGDVIIGAGAYVGPCACLRGDFGRIVVEAGANIQDTCVMHGFPGKDTVVAEGANVGHGAVLHGCVVGAGALVGMNCVINDNAEIGEDAVVAAMAFVKAEARIPPRTLSAGVPARVLRELSQEEIEWKRTNARLYQDLARRSALTMQLVEPLTAIEADRKRIHVPESIPLSELKSRKA